VRQLGDGWFKAPEFQTTYRAQIQRMIEERIGKPRNETAQPVNTVESIVNAVSALSDEDVQRIAQALLRGRGIEGPQREQKPAENEVDMESLGMNQLRTLAKLKGVNSKNMEKAELVAAIRERVEQELAGTATTDTVDDDDEQTAGKQEMIAQ